MSTSIQEYSPTEAALADLRQRYGATTYEVRTAAGMAAAKAARAEIRKWRTELEADRKRIKAEALAECQRIDSEARRITAELLALEEPIDAAIKEEVGREAAEKAAAEQAEAHRVAGIKARIEAIVRAPLDVVGKTSEEIGEKIRWLTDPPAIDSESGYAEFAAEAEAASKAALGQLRDMLYASVTAAEQAAEIARLTAEQEARDKAERARLAEIEEREAESRRKIEAAERESRRQIEEAERQARLAQQARDEVARQKREAEEAEARRVREVADEIARAKARDRAEHDDARTILRAFIRRFKHRREFMPIVAAIKKYFDQKDEVSA